MLISFDDTAYKKRYKLIEILLFSIVLYQLVITELITYKFQLFQAQILDNTN